MLAFSYSHIMLVLQLIQKSCWSFSSLAGPSATFMDMLVLQLILIDVLVLQLLPFKKMLLLLVLQQRTITHVFFSWHSMVSCGVANSRLTTIFKILNSRRYLLQCRCFLVLPQPPNLKNIYFWWTSDYSYHQALYAVPCDHYQGVHFYQKEYGSCTIFPSVY